MDIYEQITKMADEIAPELVALHHCQKADRDGV